MRAQRNKLEAKGFSALLLAWLINLAALEIASNVIPGVTLSTFRLALLAALALSLASYVVEPVLYLLTLPINIASFGVFTFVTNGAVLLAVSSFIPGFHFRGAVWGLLPATAAAVIISVFRLTLHTVLIQIRSIALSKKQ